MKRQKTGFGKYYGKRLPNVRARKNWARLRKRVRSAGLGRYPSGGARTQLGWELYRAMGNVRRSRFYRHRGVINRLAFRYHRRAANQAKYWKRAKARLRWKTLKRYVKAKRYKK